MKEKEKEKENDRTIRQGEETVSIFMPDNLPVQNILLLSLSLSLSQVVNILPRTRVIYPPARQDIHLISTFQGFPHSGIAMPVIANGATHPVRTTILIRFS